MNLSDYIAGTILDFAQNAVRNASDDWQATNLDDGIEFYVYGGGVTIEATQSMRDPFTFDLQVTDFDEYDDHPYDAPSSAQVKLSPKDSEGDVALKFDDAIMSAWSGAASN